MAQECGLRLCERGQEKREVVYRYLMRVMILRVAVSGEERRKGRREPCIGTIFVDGSVRFLLTKTSHAFNFW